MSPIRRAVPPNVAGHNPFPDDPHALVVEAWAQGYMVGSLIIMSFITVANMRRGAMLHKMILVELILGIWQGFWLFPPGRAAIWWLSAAAIPLNLSWWLHNIIAWMKIKPFLTKPWRLVFLCTVILSFPYWVLEIYSNFTYFNGTSELFLKTRPLELLFRDPWWVVTTTYLFVVIKRNYQLTLKEVVRISPRFGVMLAAMLLSLGFVVLDVLSVTGALKLTGVTGINPFWKLSFVFKCLTDSVILDDFKTALDRLRAFKISRLGSYSADFSGPRPQQNDGNLVEAWEQAERDTQNPDTQRLASIASPNGDHAKANDSEFQIASNGGIKEKEQKDSVVAPDQQTYRPRFMSLDPEDIVPSAIEDPPLQTMKTAHLPDPERGQQEWSQDVDHLNAESDYAYALRDMSGHNPPSPSKSGFSPRSHPT